MDLQFWLYVIIGVIYLISRLMKKPQAPTDFPEYGPEQPVKTEKRSAPQQEEEPSRQLAFEELLREITEGKTEKKHERKPVAPPVTSDYSYEEVSKEAEDLEDENFDYGKDDKVVKAYEEAKRQAFVRPSLEETLDIRDTDVRFGRFKEFEQRKQKNLLQEYVGNLDAEGWKKAIVLHEILQRKF